MPDNKNQAELPADETPDALTISPEKVCFIIVKAREFDVKDAVTEPDPGSNPTDDNETAVLEDHEDDPVLEELTSFIDALSEDEQIDLVIWSGSGEMTIPPAIGQRSARRLPAPTTKALRATFSARRSSATSWRRACP
jgi:hypothetical protein